MGYRSGTPPRHRIYIDAGSKERVGELLEKYVMMEKM